MAATHMAEVLEKSGNEIKLELYILIPEIDTLFTAKSYLLQVLWDGAELTACPLLEAISKKDRLDNDWISQNAAKYIDSVTILADHNFPPTSTKAFATRDKAKLPRATYKVGVTNPKWIEHLKVKQKWDTVPLDIDGW